MYTKIRLKGDLHGTHFLFGFIIQRMFLDTFYKIVRSLAMLVAFINLNIGNVNLLLWKSIFFI